MLGSYVEYGTDSEQFAWLQQDLASVDRHRTPWVVVGMHAPWYASVAIWRCTRALSMTLACPGATCGCSTSSFGAQALGQHGYILRPGMLSLRSHRGPGIIADTDPCCCIAERWLHARQEELLALALTASRSGVSQAFAPSDPTMEIRRSHSHPRAVQRYLSGLVQVQQQQGAPARGG